MNRDILLEHKGTHNTALGDRLHSGRLPGAISLSKRTNARLIYNLKSSRDTSRDGIESSRIVAGTRAWRWQRELSGYEMGDENVLEVARAGNTMPRGHIQHSS